MPDSHVALYAGVLILQAFLCILGYQRGAVLVEGGSTSVNSDVTWLGWKHAGIVLVFASALLLRCFATAIPALSVACSIKHFMFPDLGPGSFVCSLAVNA